MTPTGRSSTSAPPALPTAGASRSPAPAHRIVDRAVRVHGREAAGELERAIILYDQGPGPGEHHGVAGKALARTDLAMIRLLCGALDAGAAALAPVLALPAGQRLATLTARLVLVRRELAAPVFRDSQQARDLGDQIDEFGRAAITTGLHSLPG